MLQSSIFIPFLAERGVVEGSGHNPSSVAGRVGPYATDKANQMTANDGGCFSIVQHTAELSHTLVWRERVKRRRRRQKGRYWKEEAGRKEEEDR